MTHSSLTVEIWIWFSLITERFTPIEYLKYVSKFPKTEGLKTEGFLLLTLKLSSQFTHDWSNDLILLHKKNKISK